MLKNVQNSQITAQNSSRASLLRDLNDHHAPTNKLVVQECTRFRKGASKAGNKLFYWYSLNKKKGISHTDFFPSVLAEQMDCSTRTVERWIKELYVQGLFTLQKIKYKDNRVQYRMTPTDKFLNIKACGTRLIQAHDNNATPQDKMNYHEISLRQNVEDFKLLKVEKPYISRYIYNIENNIVLTKVDSIETFPKQIPDEKPILQLNETYQGQLIEEKEQEMSPPKTTSQTPLPVAKACSMIFKKLAEQANLSFPEVNWISFEKASDRLIRTHFGSVAVWKKYLESILSNDYLMGKRENPDGTRFILKIQTILSSKLADMFLEESGYFRVWERKEKQETEKGTLPEDTPILLTLEMVEEEHQGHPFANVYISLFKLLGEKRYSSWIKNSGFVAIGLDNGKPVFTVKAKFYRDHLLNNFLEIIEKAFA